MWKKQNKTNVFSVSHPVSFHLLTSTFTTWSINTLKLDPVMRPSEMLEVPTLHVKVVDVATSILRDTNTPWSCHNAELLTSTYTRCCWLLLQVRMKVSLNRNLKKNTALQVTSCFRRQKSEPAALLERKTCWFWCAAQPLWAFKGLQSLYSYTVLFYGVCLLPWLCFACLSNKPSKQPFYDTTREPSVHIYLCNCLRCCGEDSGTQSDWQAPPWYSIQPGSICIRPELQSEKTKNTPHNHKPQTYRRALCTCASTFH